MNQAESTQSLDSAVEELIAEIQRYLEAVALFRALDCEPSWKS